MTTPTSWEPVESFGSSAAPSELLDALEALLPGGGQRFRSNAGGRAIVLPVRVLSASGSLVAMIGELPGVAEVMFLDPATGDNAVGVLEILGDSAASVGVALPADAGTAGLVAAGEVSVPVESGRTVQYRLFRRAGWTQADRDRLAAGPKVGEGRDVTDERSRWFEKRHGGPG